jgi:hypothetical protein
MQSCSRALRTRARARTVWKASRDQNQEIKIKRSRSRERERDQEIKRSASREDPYSPDTDVSESNMHPGPDNTSELCSCLPIQTTKATSPVQLPQHPNRG